MSEATTLPLGPGMAPTAALNEWPENPRSISGEALDRLKKSLQADEELLRARPLIALPDGTVIAGNMRLRAALALGWEEIPVHVVDADPKRAREIALRDNNQFGQWESTELAQMIADLQGEGTDALLLGFGGDEIDRLIGSLEDRDREPPEPGELPEEPVTKPGQLITLGEHRLLCGDATSSEDAERLLADAGPSPLLFTSPPYADAREYGGDKNLDVEHLATFIGTYAERAELVCVNLGILRHQNAIVPYWDAYIAAAQQAGLKLLSWNIWDRGMPYSVAQQSAMFPIEHEWIFVFGRKRAKINRIVPNKRGGRVRDNVPNRQPDGSSKPGKAKLIAERRRLGTISRIAPAIGQDTPHPAVFPVRLPAEYLQAASAPGDLVIDPFGGAGSTLIACEQFGRRCRTVELDPAYCDVIVERWEKYTGREAEREDP